MYTDADVLTEIINANQAIEAILNNDDIEELLLKEQSLLRLEEKIGLETEKRIEESIGYLLEKGEKMRDLHEVYHKNCGNIEETLLEEYANKPGFSDYVICEADKKRLVDCIKEAYEGKLAAYTELNAMNFANKTCVVGIDFGTSYTSCAIYEDGKCMAIKIDHDEDLSPSVVAYDIPTAAEQQAGASVPGKTPLVGMAAKNQDWKNPLNTIYEPKRVLARLFKNEQLQQDMKYWQTTIVPETGRVNARALIQLSNGERVEPQEVVSLLLRKVRAEAKKHCNSDVTFVVITIPVKVTYEYQTALKHAAKDAGFKDVHFMREPVAAALSYRKNMPDLLEGLRKIVIFDFGGGTLDLCVLESDKNSLRVIETGGDQHFGGKNFDKAIFDYLIKEKKDGGNDYLLGKYSADPAVSMKVKQFESRLLAHIEKAKRDLSIKEKTSFTLVDEEKGDVVFEFTRETFEKENERNFQKIHIKLAMLFISKKVERNEITHVIMVGGMSNVPRVKKAVRDFFGDQWHGEITDKEDKQLAVAFGAARKSAEMKGFEMLGKDYGSLNKYRLQDVVPAAIGIGRFSQDGNVFQTVIPRGSVIPCEEKIECTTSKTQMQVFVPIYEGDIERNENVVSTNDPRLSRIGDFTLKTSGKKAGEERIDVYISYDSNLKIRIRAVNHTNRQEEFLKIESEYAISKAARDNLRGRLRLLDQDDRQENEYKRETDETESDREEVFEEEEEDNELDSFFNK